jgi:hypothetical protein
MVIGNLDELSDRMTQKDMDRYNRDVAVQNKEEQYTNPVQIGVKEAFYKIFSDATKYIVEKYGG